MNRNFAVLELLILSTAVGIIATFAAPWVELRGTFAAWNITEWHTFWRGEDAFQLASVVASDYRVLVEYATAEMQATMRNLFTLGSALGAWHIVALSMLLVASARWRVRDGASKARVAFEIVVLVAVNTIVLSLLATLLALPSSITSKVDFRTAEDIHTNSLIWSSVNVLPVAPVLVVLAVIGQLVAVVMSLNNRMRLKTSDD